MSEPNDLSSVEFQQKLYQELDDKLKLTPWNSGVSEAHGLLTGLACRGISPQKIGNKMYLLKISEPRDISLLEGMFEIIVQDMESSEPTFNPLLPDENATNYEKASELANWSDGYLQGFCHDGESVIENCSGDIQELIDDLLAVSGMGLEDIGENVEKDEKCIVEIEEYLRMAVQLIYDELIIATRESMNSNSAEIH